MIVVINAVFYHEKARGVGRVCNNLIEKLAYYDKKNEYYVYYGKWMQYNFLKIKQENFHFIELDISRNPILRNLYLAFILPFKIKKHKPTVYHLLDTSPLFFKTCKTISTVHDLAEFTVPEKYSKFKCYFRKKYVKMQLQKSNLVITDSEYSKKDMINRFNLAVDKVKVIYCFFESNIEFKTDRTYKKYFLIVGEIERTKNIGQVIKAFSLLPKAAQDEYSVYIVGRKGNDYESVKEIVSECKLEEKIVFFDYVTDEKLFDLYQNAYALIFASLFEGFGLPILEAMTFGIPVISSNVTSMPEVIGDAGLLFDPNNAKALSENMKLLIDNPSMRIELIEKGFEQARKFKSREITQEILEIYYSFER